MPMLIVDGKNYDIIEAIEVNFDGILNDMKVEKDDFGRYIYRKNRSFTERT